MSTQPNTNPQQPPADNETAKISQPQEDPLIQKTYKDLTAYIRDTYFPHYNLYQRAMLKDKVKCYELHNQDPEQYYICIDKVEEFMRNNNTNIKIKFDIAEAVDKQCQAACKQNYSEDREKYTGCVLTCAKNMKEACSTIYNQFYDKVLEGFPEYQKIKK